MEELTLDPNLLGVPVQKAGKRTDELCLDFGLETIIGLSANENPLGPSPLAVEAMRQALPLSHRYPGLCETELRVKIAELFGAEFDEENVVGVRLPLLARVECEVADYSLLARPAWVDLVVDRLKQVAEERTRLLVLAERVRILELHERRTTQRVNLFEQILIPTAKRNIQRIQIFLGDAERAAVVRSKLAKAKQEKARRAALSGGAAT